MTGRVAPRQPVRRSAAARVGGIGRRRRDRRRRRPASAWAPCARSRAARRQRPRAARPRATNLLFTARSGRRRARADRQAQHLAAARERLDAASWSTSRSSTAPAPGTALSATTWARPARGQRAHGEIHARAGRRRAARRGRRRASAGTPADQRRRPRAGRRRAGPAAGRRARPAPPPAARAPAPRGRSAQRRPRPASPLTRATCASFGEKVMRTSVTPSSRRERDLVADRQHQAAAPRPEPRRGRGHASG